MKENRSPFEYEFHWMDVIFTLVIIGIIACCFWALKSNADEVDPDSEIYYPGEFFIDETAILHACFNEALKVTSEIEFDTYEDYMHAVSSLTGGCMYYQMLEQSSCLQTPFAYPIEPDGRPSEFNHQF